jgi:hypothetical protein
MLHFAVESTHQSWRTADNLRLMTRMKNVYGSHP